VTSTQIVALLVFLAIVVAVGVLGVRLGMLLAPRIGRLAERGDEEDRADDDA
jgi:NADH:ubiquinone oxidoreductase subunit 3 (subunit A)